MEDWRIKWLRMAMLRLHTLLPAGFTVRQLSNASFTLKAPAKRFAEQAATDGWLSQVDIRPSKSGRSMEAVYVVTPSGRAALIAEVSPLHRRIADGQPLKLADYLGSIEAAEEAVKFYVGKVDRGEDTFPGNGGKSSLGDFRKAIKTCLADYEALKDVNVDIAKQVGVRIWAAIKKANDAMVRENPRYKGSLLDYFKGEG
jgi:hypothetical protein